MKEMDMYINGYRKWFEPRRISTLRQQALLSSIYTVSRACTCRRLFLFHLVFFVPPSCYHRCATIKPCLVRYFGLSSSHYWRCCLSSVIIQVSVVLERLLFSTWFEPRSISSLFSVIVLVSAVLNTEGECSLELHSPERSH